MADTAVSKRPQALDTLKVLMPHIPALLPPDIGTEQFRAALWLELSKTQSLLECTQESLREAVIKAANAGLLFGRDCHLLPFGNRRGGGKKEATFVPNYFGLIRALDRTGKVRRAFAHPVHEGDEYRFDMFQDRPMHVPAATLGKDAGAELFYYGAIMFKDGTCAFEVVSLEDLVAIEKRAPAHESGPWVTDKVMMRRKSCIKRVAKYVQLTPELRQLLEDDEIRERSDIPPERAKQNIIDLFGDDEGSPSRNPTMPTGSQTVTVTPDPSDPSRVLPREVPPHDATATGRRPAGRAAPTPPQGPAWETLRAYQADGRLSEALLDRIASALAPLAPATESEANELAGIVLDWIAQAEEQAGSEEGDGA